MWNLNIKKINMIIIYAHPNKDGHCGQILKELTKRLNEKKINYTILDLYEMNYDPVLKNNEHYTSGHFDVSEKNKKIQDMIKNESKFIFIYPTWWNNMPAILKGFVDRVFTNKFSFEYVHGIPCGLLRGKAVAFTTTGTFKIAYYLFLGRRSLKILTKDSLRFCGLKSRGYAICNSTKLNEKQIKKINKAVNNGLKYLS